METRMSARIARSATRVLGLAMALTAADFKQAGAQSRETVRPNIPVTGLPSPPAPAPAPAPIVVPPPGRPSASALAPAPAPAPVVVPPADTAAPGPTIAGIPWDESLDQPPARPTQFLPSAPGSSFLPAKVVMGPLDVIHESLFGPAKEEDWKPLTLGTFFSEGWDQPYVNAPPGTNGAPKQNWIGAPAGVFGRFATLDFFYTNHLNNVPGNFLTPNAPFMPVHPFANGNQYAGYTTIFLPLNSRFELLLGTVFIADNRVSPGGPYVGNWGDTGVQARFHLVDQRNFSMVALVGERIPTGKSVNGNDINYITPGLEAWWNFAPKWVARGGTQINILTGRKTSNSVYVNQLSMGRYLTDKDAAFFKQLEVHVTASVLSDTSGGVGHGINDVYIFPGMRFSLDKEDKLAFLGGVQVPVSGPQAYAWQPQFSLTWKW